MSGPIDFSNFAKNSYDPTAPVADQLGVSGTSMSMAGVPITNPSGLRRWRAALADALFAEAPIVVGGDSRVYGQNANGSLTFTPADGRADAPLCFAGQLRSLFAQQYGDPGEGYISPVGDLDSGAVVAGSGFAFTGHGQAGSLLRRNWRLPPAASTITLIAAPSNVTRVQTILSSHTGEAAGQFQINGGTVTSLGFGTSDDVPSLKSTAVTSGQVFNAANNAGGNVTYLGFCLRTAQTNGVPVHRIGVPGNTIGDWQGGVFNGVYGTYDGSTFSTAAEQTIAIRAMYKWNPTPGLLIVHTGGNEQSLQATANTIGCGVTPAIFKVGVQNVVNTAVSDGWAVLLIGPNASGSELAGAGIQPSTAYSAQLQAIAATTDHCAYLNVDDLWGGSDQTAKDNAFNAGLRDHFSAHPFRKGYGDIARHLHRVLSMVTPVGN